MDATAPVGSAADRVYAHVRYGILSRRFADADLLAEGRIAQETGVSRTPVREALLRLEAEGMVRLLPKRGALVLPVTVQEARDLLETRELVETFCVARILEAGQGAAVALRLDGALADQQRAVGAGDLVGYAAADRSFHEILVSSAGNAILVRLYATLRDRQLRMGAANLLDPSGNLDPRRAATTLEDHTSIRDALLAGDVGRAQQLITDHLAHTSRSLT